MDYNKIKKQANDILKTQAAECSYIEYKASSNQHNKILKTLCAYGNNYYDNDVQFLFIGVEEINNESDKSVPKLPIKGINEGSLEKCKNEINSLRPFLYPNVSFELITNEFNGKKYILIVVTRQTGGPFMVSERAEKEKKIQLKAGRYVRIEAETRLARVDEEYDLLRKFANFHFSSITNEDAQLDDLSSDLLREYLGLTSARKITADLNKAEMSKSLRLIDKNDPSGKKVKNFAVLMFTQNPERFIPYAYVDIIIDMFGSKQRMESKSFKGPLWKLYYQVVKFINDNYLNTLVIRENGNAENRKVSNFPYVALEELVANAIVHNNFENYKPIQIYISEKEINIVNYNKPLPPLKISDLNQRTFFNERDTENPEIRDMFKALGIIESFGTGIGEAKRAMKENGSPELYYKEFEDNYNVTSVVIPVNEEYFEIKNGIKPKQNLGIEHESQVVKKAILSAKYSDQVIENLMRIYNKVGDDIFGNSKVVEILGCSETTATTYLKILNTELNLIYPVTGHGKGKYIFRK